MKSSYIIIVGLLFIFGIIIGYSIYAVSDKFECQLRRSDIQNCIEQANILLDIVINKDYCAATYDINQFNFSFNFTLPEVNTDGSS